MDENSKRQLMTLFLDEVQERTHELEQNLLVLEGSPEPDARFEVLTTLLRIAHSLKGAAGLLEVRPLESLCHLLEDLFSEARRGGKPIEKDQIGMLLETSDAMAEYSRVLSQGIGDSAAPIEERLSSLTTALSGQLQRQADAPANVPDDAFPPAALKHSDAGETAPALGEHFVRTAQEGSDLRARDIEGSLRIRAEKLDSLLFRSGELLLSRSRSESRLEQVSYLHKLCSNSLRPISRGPNGRASAPRTLPQSRKNDMTLDLERGLRQLAEDLAEDTRLLRRTTTFLEGELRLARMLPFNQACHGLARIVRDSSAHQGKSVELVVEDDDIQIDRSILVGLQDALRHLVRNAVDHGLESPEERTGTGKPARGQIVITARLRGDQLQVRVEDDGRGIDVASLRQHAADEREVAENEDVLLRRIFVPGVSTAQKVTHLSGRGMGLDIVRRAVENLRGSVDVEHAAGRGTAFILTLPLTLITSRVVLLSAAGQVFALDVANVQRVFTIPKEHLQSVMGRAALLSDGRTIPVLDLDSWLGVSTAPRKRNPESIPIILIEASGKQVALLVNEVIGEQELLIRDLGPRLARLRLFNGGAILPDGEIALVLNSAALSEDATSGKLRYGLSQPDENEKPPVRKRILVVDDSLTVRTIEKIILEAAGYLVFTASDGAEAWDLLQAHGADAVVADVDMPGVDGFMLTEMVRRSQQLKNLPVILVSAREKVQDKTRGLEAGADAYIVKSTFDQRQLLDAIRQALGG